MTLLLKEKKLEIEVDTGATFSVISEVTQQVVFPTEILHASNIILKTYTNEPMKVLGTLNMRVKYCDQEEKLILIVVACDGPSLMGRNWLKYIHLNWKSIFTVRSSKLRPLNTLLQWNKELFEETLGQIHPFTTTIKVQADATPRSHKARPIPYTLCNKGCHQSGAGPPRARRDRYSCHSQQMGCPHRTCLKERRKF